MLSYIITQEVVLELNFSPWHHKAVQNGQLRYNNLKLTTFTIIIVAKDYLLAFSCLNITQDPIKIPKLSINDL